MRYQKVSRSGSRYHQVRQQWLAPGALVLALSGATWASPASAEQAAAAMTETTGTTGTVARKADDNALPGMMVTARQSEEAARDIPFGLSVISGEKLDDLHLNTLDDALRSTPGVNLNSDGGTNSSNVLIRGVGSLNPVSTDDGSVGLNIDGVAMSMRNMSLGTLDIERIEILKGSQGTMFGGNSMAGTINVTTRKPTRTVEGYVRGEYGQDHQHLEEAVLSGPLSERLSGRFAIRNSGYDHWLDNRQTGQAISKPTDLAYRASLLWDIGSGTNALLTAEREQIKRTPSMTLLRPFSDPPVADFTPGVFDSNDKTVERYSAEVNHDLAASRLSSITAYTSTRYLSVAGYDATMMQALYGGGGQYVRQDASDQHAISQDLRWSSLPGAPLFWVGGINLSHADRSFNTSYVTGTYQNRSYQTDSYALYGEVTFPLTDKLKATTGLRRSWDRKSYDASYSSSPGVPDRREINDAYTTGRMGLSYALTPTTNLYSMLSRGYQSGGFGDFTTQAADSTPYKAAVSNSAEVGFKITSSDQRFTLNGALYLTRVKDNHLLSYDYTTFASNTVTGDTRSKGAELEATWRLDNGLAFSGGLSYIDAKITSTVTGAAAGTVTAGSRVPDVPQWGANLAASYRKNVSSQLGLSAAILNVRLSYQYVGSRAADPQNHFDLGRYQKVDSRIGLMLGNTEVYVYGNNLLNQQYDLYGYYNAANVLSGAPARGRNVGIGLTHFF